MLSDQACGDCRDSAVYFQSYPGGLQAGPPPPFSHTHSFPPLADEQACGCACAQPDTARTDLVIADVMQSAHGSCSQHIWTKRGAVRLTATPALGNHVQCCNSRRLLMRPLLPDAAGGQA